MLTTDRPVFSASWHTRVPTKPLPPKTSSLGGPVYESCAHSSAARWPGDSRRPGRPGSPVRWQRRWRQRRPELAVGCHRAQAGHAGAWAAALPAGHATACRRAGSIGWGTLEAFQQPAGSAPGLLERGQQLSVLAGSKVPGRPS